MQRYLTCKEAMNILNISSKNTMTKLLRREDFPAYKIEGSFRIGEDELDAWIRKQKHQSH